MENEYFCSWKSDVEPEKLNELISSSVWVLQFLVILQVLKLRMEDEINKVIRSPSEEFAKNCVNKSYARAGNQEGDLEIRKNHRIFLKSFRKSCEYFL
ncbi:unnamed protein product [Caenorhabditis angaria]|uniref:Uncharacterized protein n=1 Tax=Caenorhabditis angaria TaxID=860376 RepID=A0A9P1N803_9PELO|nr:unnamed protein product [Caenorhabditis angaria]